MKSEFLEWLKKLLHTEINPFLLFEYSLPSLYYSFVVGFSLPRDVAWLTAGSQCTCVPPPPRWPGFGERKWRTLWNLQKLNLKQTRRCVFFVTIFSLKSSTDVLLLLLHISLDQATVIVLQRPLKLQKPSNLKRPKMATLNPRKKRRRKRSKRRRN